jgi:6-phosphofructokinase 2
MKIVTLTLNPALDKTTAIDNLKPEKKLRCDQPEYKPGGGGINVSRAISILGGESLAIYVSFGHSKKIFQQLLDKEGIEQKIIDGIHPTRENLIVYERSGNNQYRFGMPGKEIGEQAMEECVELIKNLPPDVEYLVASGSLPPGVPDDFYQKLTQIAHDKNIRFVLDTSGKALIKATESNVDIMKPNLNELRQLAGKDVISGKEQEEIAKKIIDEGKANILFVSLGARGAMAVDKNSIEYAVPPTVMQVSTVGAGDSMVGSIILSLSRGENLKTALRWGVAAGTAATMTPGAELCRREDVENLFRLLGC